MSKISLTNSLPNTCQTLRLEVNQEEFGKLKGIRNVFSANSRIKEIYLKEVGNSLKNWGNLLKNAGFLDRLELTNCNISDYTEYYIDHLKAPKSFEAELRKEENWQLPPQILNPVINTIETYLSGIRATFNINMVTYYINDNIPDIKGGTLTISEGKKEPERVSKDELAERIQSYLIDD